MRSLAFIFSFIFAAALFGCRREVAPVDSGAPKPDAGKPPAAAVAEVAVMKTSAGEMVFEFWPDVAPKTVENFKKLARSGFYEHTAFHRIIKDFMIQGGCPNSKPGATGMPGTGDPGYKIKAEFNYKAHVRGVLSMARSASPDSAGSQFFVCTTRADFLDGKYTAFGKLIKGDAVLEKIAGTPVTYGPGGEKSIPAARVEILKIEIEPASTVQKQ